ncbi:MAG TPA: response regulator transcription factor [Thermoanaerobaculia bacterium]|jgi:DNA-binding NarL/FixJ family response regulator|nr:response regulator transcription factor [Thermoanaerobaculia bacterium]
MRILVIDAHPVVHEGLRAIFARTGDIEGTTARDRDEALAELRHNHFDLVIVALSLPGRSGLSLVTEIKEHQPRLPVLIFTSHCEQQLVIHALRHGASGYVTKDCTPEELLVAVRRIGCGGKYVNAALSEALVGNLQTTDLEPHERLSKREFEIMCMIASGKSTGAIAKSLALEKTTISTYRTRILHKMDFTCTAEIIRYAIENALVC